MVLSKNVQFIKMLPIETDRLVIRSISLDDVDLFLKMDSQEQTQKFLGGIKNKTREERLKLISDKINKFNDGIASMLTICLKDGTPIGFSGLSINDNNDASISYLYDFDYWNNGYCYEVCRKLIEIGFNDLKLDKIYADLVQDNIRSKRVLEKLGFKLDKVRKKDEVIFLDYVLLKRDIWF